MKPHDQLTNGDEGAGAEGADSEGSEPEDALTLEDAAAPARALATLNALRKARQHFDTLLLAPGGEVAAHRAVLAAASPVLLAALAGDGAPAALRLDDAEPDALRELVEWAYTGRARAQDGAAARRLYRCAARLRAEPLRAALAERLLRRVAPADCLQLRALPDLAPDQLRQLDRYIADNFDSVCASGALAALPLVRIELLRESSTEDGAEAPLAVADAALAWLCAHGADLDIEELCARTHLLYVDDAGALRDCGELPEARGDAPALRQYRDAARARPAGAAPGAAPAAGAVLAARAECALVALRGRLVAARAAWREAGAGGPGVLRGGALRGRGGAGAARLAAGRCAHGTAALDGRLVVCGGYDRARALSSAESFDPRTGAWSALPDMGRARARFPAARLGGALLALGGSDGAAELDSVLALEGGAWRARARLPLALAHAGAAALGGRLFVVGGWAGGAHVRRVLQYCPAADAWSDAPPLHTGRSQCAAVAWQGALWALGGCDAWHCLASTETLALGAGAEAAWRAGPPLPTARRAVGAAAWRGWLVAAGGSDGAASLRRTEWLAAGGAAWRPGPALRAPRAALGLAALGDALVAVAGFDGKQFLSCAECLLQPDGEWTELRALPPPRDNPPPAPPQEERPNGESEAAQ